MILFPNAKINFGLNIMSKRPDGYHDIASLMLPVDWHDILEIVPAKNSNTTLTLYGNKVDCPAEDNLVMKAYRAMQREFNIPAVDIYLSKIIPDGAGLGGGSADASFTLTGLNELFKLGVSSDKLADIAASLGADCPFFIYNRPMLATGTGTDLYPIDINLKDFVIVIVKPSDKVPTREAYAGTSPLPWSPSLETLIANGDLFQLRNDFETSVFPKHPTIERIKEYFLENGACYSAMSGSGSSVYALYKTIEDASIAAESLGQHNIVHIGKFL